MVVIKYYQMTDFHTWLNKKIDDKGWKPADLSKKGNIDSGYLSRILNDGKIPGYKTCQGIARAFGIDEDEVLIAAGKKKPTTNVTSNRYQRIADLPPDQRKMIEEFMDFIIQRNGNE